jgi:6-phosphogluconolactonase
VVVHTNGRFVYGSNRGHDSTAVYAIDQETGELERIQIEPTLGGHPRHIGIDPTGTYFIAANRDDNNLVSFSIDQETGRLAPTGHQTDAPIPVCVVFLQ